MTTSLDQLRLAVAFTHAVPCALLSIHLAAGRTLRCGHDRRSGADVHPCKARQLVAEARAGGPVDWLVDVVGLDLGGPHLVDEGGGLYRAEAAGPPSWSFATTLAPLAVRAAAVDAFAEADAGAAPGVEAAAAAPLALDLRALVDRPLGVVVVTCRGGRPPGAAAPGPCPPADAVPAHAPLAEAARRLVAACLVGELCGAGERGGRW